MAKDKIIAIGDIHGCIRSLNSLLEKLSSFEDYLFIFIGDYIDRGNDPKGVVDRLMEFEQEQECVFIRGNHEQMLLDSVYKNDLDLWLQNGGKSTISSYGGSYRDLNIPEEHLEFYKKTQMYYDTDDYFFVHAGLSADKTIKECLQSEEEMQKFLWERDHLNAFETPWEKTIVFGHTPRSHPIKKYKMRGIDTGCVFDRLGYGKLTAIILPDEDYVQQICLDN